MDSAMQVSVTTTHGLERRLEIAVPGERLAGEVDQKLKRLARTARVKGFRPGKVPYAVVKQQFGSQVHAEAVTQERLRPAGGPRIEPIKTEPGSELRYAAVFEVFPEVAVQSLEGAQADGRHLDCGPGECTRGRPFRSHHQRGNECRAVAGQ